MNDSPTSNITELRLVPARLALGGLHPGDEVDAIMALATHSDVIVRGNALRALGHIAERTGELSATARTAIEFALTPTSSSASYVYVQANMAAAAVANATHEPLIQQPTVTLLWTGLATGREWVAQRLVTSLDSGNDTWVVVLETSDGLPKEYIQASWCPRDRVLACQLDGWSKSSIGNLKRTLTQTR
jgi:hypothetical protein